MTILTACEVLSNRLRDNFGIERTPKQVGEFLATRVCEFTNPRSQREMQERVADVLNRLLADHDQLSIIAADMRASTSVGPVEEA